MSRSGRVLGKGDRGKGGGRIAPRATPGNPAQQQQLGAARNVLFLFIFVRADTFAEPTLHPCSLIHHINTPPVTYDAITIPALFMATNYRAEEERELH